MIDLQWNSCPHFLSCAEDNTNSAWCEIQLRQLVKTTKLSHCHVLCCCVKRSNFPWDMSTTCQMAASLLVLILWCSWVYMSQLSDYPTNFNTSTKDDCFSDSPLLLHCDFKTAPVTSPKCNSIQSINKHHITATLLLPIMLCSYNTLPYLQLLPNHRSIWTTALV